MSDTQTEATMPDVDIPDAIPPLMEEGQSVPEGKRLASFFERVRKIAGEYKEAWDAARKPAQNLAKVLVDFRVACLVRKAFVTGEGDSVEYHREEVEGSEVTYLPDYDGRSKWYRQFYAATIDQFTANNVPAEHRAEFRRSIQYYVGREVEKRIDGGNTELAAAKALFGNTGGRGSNNGGTPDVPALTIPALVSEEGDDGETVTRATRVAIEKAAPLDLARTILNAAIPLGSTVFAPEWAEMMSNMDSGERSALRQFVHRAAVILAQADSTLDNVNEGIDPGIDRDALAEVGLDLPEVEAEVTA